MSALSDWQDVRKLLCIRLDNMGDVLMTTPALRALKNGEGKRELTLLASSSGARLGPFLPDVDHVITYDAPWVRNDIDDPDADRDIIVNLQGGHFDAAVIFTVYTQNPLPAALMCRLAGIPRVLAHCRENPYRLLSHHVAESEPGQIRHETQRQLDLVAKVGAYSPDCRLSFVTRAADHHSLNRKLNAAGVQDGAVVVAHCGASAASRRYPASSFAAVFRLLGHEAGPIVLTGDASETELTHQIKNRRGYHGPLAGGRESDWLVPGQDGIRPTGPGCAIHSGITQGCLDAGTPERAQGPRGLPARCTRGAGRACAPLVPQL